MLHCTECPHHFEAVKWRNAIYSTHLGLLGTEVMFKTVASTMKLNEVDIMGVIPHL